LYSLLTSNTLAAHLGGASLDAGVLGLELAAAGSSAEGVECFAN